MTKLASFCAIIVNFEQISHLALVLFFLTFFGNVSHTKKQTKDVLDAQIIYDGALCNNIILGSYFALTKQLQIR